MSRTGDDMAKELRRHRPALLACEAIGWLHMTGKAHKNFLVKHGYIGVDYDVDSWHQELKQMAGKDWDQFFKWLVKPDNQQLEPGEESGERHYSCLKWPITLVDFLTGYDKRPSNDDPQKSWQNLVGCLQAGHAMSSGIEKNVYNSRFTGYLQQNAPQMWLVTAFGHPVRNLLLDPPEASMHGGWNKILERITQLLSELEELGANNADDLASWWEWRESAIGSNGWLRTAFGETLAETRVPNNDVTLWDQSYVASALFKSAAAGLVLLKNIPVTAWDNLKQETRWRILTVGIGADYYEARAVRIGDWLGVQQKIEDFFEDVRQLIEVDIAVGSLLYRDDQILTFSFPGQRFDDERQSNNRSLDEIQAQELGSWLEKQILELAKQHQLDTPPFCHLSKSTRSLLSMGMEATEARKALAIPVSRPWSVTGDSGQGHVCPVCQVRVSYESSRRKENNPKQRLCGVCTERRKGRLATWLLDGADTIWISELADDNNRVAVLTFGFDLNPWLDGARVDSLRTQSIADWRRFNDSQKNIRSQIDQNDPTDSLLKHTAIAMRNAVRSKDGKLKNGVLRSIHPGFGEEDVATFYNKMVEDRADNPPRWEEVKDDPNEGARWLVHQLFRKYASPARTYRFWRTVENFFDELLPALREVVSTHSNLWRTRRLVLIPAEGSLDELEDRESYSARWKDVPLELLYRRKWNAGNYGQVNGDFITICNLARLLRNEDRKETLQQDSQGSLELIGTDHSASVNVTIKSVKDNPWPGAYAPLIVLNRSPRRFRVMVPLEAAPACIELVIRKYETEFARVWDRMPLYVGVVGFSRMTPFQAVIEAVRNVEDSLMRKKEEHWTVAGSYLRDGNCHLTMTRPDGVHETMAVPVTLPDGRPDVFYPYVAVTDADRRNPRDFAKPATEREKQVVYRHVADLAPNDTVHVAPSRFASVFMDSTALRFEPVEVHYLSEWRRLRETWEILRRNTRDITSLRRAWAYLADAQERWKSDDEQPQDRLALFTSFARTVLKDQLGIQPPVLDTLVEAAVSGTLERTLDWHLRVLKLDLEDQWS